MNKKYSNKTKEKVIEQYLAGVSVSDLVSKFNVSRTTVYTRTPAKYCSIAFSLVLSEYFLFMIFSFRFEKWKV